MSAKNSADSSEKDEDFESGNAPGATQERTPLDFRLVNRMPAPPGQMVRDLAGWQAQQQDQNMMDQSPSTEPLPSGTLQPEEVDNQREQMWQQFIQANPNIQRADQSQVVMMAVEGGETPYTAPRPQNFPFNSIEELAEDMRHNGLRWRHNLRERVADDPNLKRLLDWVTYRPSPASEPTRSLAEILFDLQILPHDQGKQIMDMGDGYVQMPVAFFEHHAYPTAFLRAYLGTMRKEGYGEG
jgi:hypothetical protein